VEQMPHVATASTAASWQICHV